MPTVHDNHRYEQALSLYNFLYEEGLIYSAIESDFSSLLDGMLPPKSFVEDERIIINRTIERARNHPEHGDLIQKIIEISDDSLRNINDSRKELKIWEITKALMDIYVEETNYLKGYEGELAISSISLDFENESEEELAHYNPLLHEIVVNKSFYKSTKEMKAIYGRIRK